MSERNLSAILGPRAHPISSPETHSRPEEEDEYRAFGSGRVGNRPQIMLTLTKSDSYRVALPYASLECIRSHNIETQLELQFPGKTVTIEGGNLARLFRLLAENKCVEVLERPSTGLFDSAGDAPVVSRIALKERGRNR